MNDESDTKCCNRIGICKCASFTDKQEGYDYIRCPICSQKVYEISYLHAKMHGFHSSIELAEHFNMKSSKCQKAIDRMKGSNNPGHGHNGVLSPWSIKSGRSKEEIEESKKLAKKNSKGRRPSNIEYYLNKGYSREEAIELRKAHQSNGLKKMQKIYGQEEGLHRWKDRQIKWQNTLNSKDLEEKQAINRKKMVKGYSISAGEISLAESIKKSINDIETQVSIVVDGKNYIYDIAFKNKIVEFFGDFWHHNPTIYAVDWKHPLTKLFSKERWDRDEARIDIAKQAGFDVLIIWESDYKKHKEEVVEKCIAFLKA